MISYQACYLKIEWSKASGMTAQFGSVEIDFRFVVYGPEPDKEPVAGICRLIVKGALIPDGALIVEQFVIL